MFVRCQRVPLWLVVIGLAASSAVAQDSHRGRGRGNRDRQNDAQNNGEARGPQAANDNPSEQRGGDRGGRSRNRGDRGGPPREFTPEDRERFYSGMVDRYMERYSRNYELTDAQKEQVRTRLEEVKTQQRAYSEQHSSEFQSLRQEFSQLRSSGQADPQKFRELRERFDALRSDSPLFNDDRVAENVEQLLPPEQVQAGRARRQAESAARDQEREQRRQEWEQRRQQREAQPQQENPPADGQAQDQPVPTPPTTERPDGQHQHGGDREARRREWRDRHENGTGSHGEGGHRDVGHGSHEQPQFVQQAGQAAQSSTVIPENPIGPWEQYVRDFIRQFKLDDAQQATAQSVLREVQKRRVSYEQTHRADFDTARRIEAGGDREKRLADLNKPVVSMFEELKSRLNRIPSSAQRQAAGVVSVATSRPSFSTIITTRPAGERNTANPSGNSSH